MLPVRKLPTLLELGSLSCPSHTTRSRSLPACSAWTGYLGARRYELGLDRGVEVGQLAVGIVGDI